MIYVYTYIHTYIYIYIQQHMPASPSLLIGSPTPRIFLEAKPSPNVITTSEPRTHANHHHTQKKKRKKETPPLIHL
jgi:hypothetical protein